MTVVTRNLIKPRQSLEYIQVIFINQLEDIKMKKMIFIFMVGLVLFFNNSTQAEPKNSCNRYFQYGNPAKKAKDVEIQCYEEFARFYDPTRRNSILTIQFLEKTDDKNFMKWIIGGNSKIKKPYKTETIDYRGSGFIEAFLTSPEHMIDKGSLIESLRLTNTAPQTEAVNRIWRVIEKNTQNLLQVHKKLVAFTGVTYKNREGFSYSFGKNGIEIPTHFYLILFDPNTNGAIAYMIPNEHTLSKKEMNPEKYLTTIDIIERETKLDFLSGLHDRTENQTESMIPKETW